MKPARLFSIFLVLAAAPSCAGTLYSVSIDTSSLTAGTTGFIDFTFDGGFPATASIYNFSPGAALDSSTLQTLGTITGTLPGEVDMSNDDSDYFEGISFGSPISFLLGLSGTPGGTQGDTFTLTFYNADISGGLLTGNVSDAWLAQWQMDTAGNITPAAYANPSGGPSFASIQLITPEPGSALLLLAGLAGAMVLRRRIV